MCACRQENLKYGETAKKIEAFCMEPIEKALPDLVPEIGDVQGYLARVRNEYRAMLLRTPGIGGKSLEKNLYEAAFAFSLYKAQPDLITPAVVDRLADAVFDMRFAGDDGEETECVLFSDEVQDRKVKESRESQDSPYEMDWKFDYRKGEDEFFNTYTECGICKLGKRENCSAFVPCMCNTDWRVYRHGGARLIRPKTLAGGDDHCSFHVVRLGSDKDRAAQ